MWTRLTTADLQEVLSYDEFEKLNELSLSGNISAICQPILDSVADLFRGAFVAKGYAIDVREHYMSQYYKLPVLNYTRYQIWTRFPQSNAIGIDEPRDKSYEEAKELLKDPYLGTEKPDYSTDPELSSRTDLTAIADASLTIPYQRIVSWPWKYGFPGAYVRDGQYGDLSAFL